MYKVYILQSLKNKRYYIGHTKNLENRLAEHNSGRVRSTKAYVPWLVIYTEKRETRPEAYQREREIKNYKSGVQFKGLLGV